MLIAQSTLSLSLSLSLSVFLAILPYRQSLLAGSLEYIQYLHRAEYASLCWSVDTGVSISSSPYKKTLLISLSLLL